MEAGITPKNGSKSDQAHPPIHPTKYTNSLSVNIFFNFLFDENYFECLWILFKGNDKSVYDFIVRHFLACCSKDAKGFETTISIDINQEKFSTSGLMITERNYLEVYVYDKWSDKVI